jgi:hypothetical protein
MSATANLVVFRSTALCDGSCGGEATLVTDGRTAYAYTSANRDIEMVLRDAEVLTSSGCPNAGRGPDPECHGEYHWALDVPGTWTADADAIKLLATCGSDVEVTG